MIKFKPSIFIMKTRRVKHGKKFRGGMSDEIRHIIDTTEIGKPVIVNPESNFVVVTYWWGRGNENKNINKMCRDQVLDRSNIDLSITEVPGFIDIDRKFNELQKSFEQTGQEPPEWRAVSKQRADILIPRFKDPKIREKLAEMEPQTRAKLLNQGELDPPKKMEQMIDDWKKNMEEMKCNYLVTEYDIPRKFYQQGINAKPYFIKKCLDVCGGKSVLYIDGDMRIHKFPSIFEIKNVDFMSRGWNMDPRGDTDYLEGEDYTCFDPWQFETSGGTMFFSNSQHARKLLDLWIAEAMKPIHEGKADDRVISMLITLNRIPLTSNIIQLPIEYLWLSREYDVFQYEGAFASMSEVFISHPACLTSEDTAREQGAASDRKPEGYNDAYIDQACKDGGIWYEYIVFNGDTKLLPSMAKYFDYLERAGKSSGFAYRIVNFYDKYGKFNQIANTTLASAKTLKDSYANQTGNVQLPMNAPVPEIIARLMNGQSVTIGGNIQPPLDNEVEIVATRIVPKPQISRDGKPIPEISIRELIVDTNSPIYFSANNPIIVHLLAMCNTLADINTHLKDSYLFQSRIRWQLTDKQQGAKRKTKKRRITKGRRTYF